VRFPWCAHTHTRKILSTLLGEESPKTPLHSAFLFLQNLYASKPVPPSKISKSDVKIVDIDSSAANVVTDVTTNTDVTVNAGCVVVLVACVNVLIGVESEVSVRSEVAVCIAVALVIEAVVVIEEETTSVEVNAEEVSVGVGLGVEIVVNVGVLVKVYADV